MPITYEVDEAQNAVYAWVSGQVRAEDFLAYVQQFLADSRIKPGYRELVDATAAVPSDITAELFNQIAEIDRRFPEMLPGSRTAIVVPHASGFELARQYQKVARMQVLVFFSLEVAREWLGI